MPPEYAATIANPQGQAPAENVRALSADALRPAPDAAEAETLLPQTLGGLFDEAFDLYKRHFTTIALTVACVYLPTLALYHIINTIWLHPLEVTGQDAKGDAAGLIAMKVGLLYIAEFALLGFGLILASGPATAAIAACSQNQTITVREAFRRFLPSLPRLVTHGIVALLGFFIAIAGGFFATSMVVGLLGLAFGATKIEWLITLFAILMAALMVLVPYLCGTALLARYFLLTPALTVLENLPLNALMERNGQLARKANFRRVWLAAIFLPLVTIGLQILVAYAAESLLSVMRLNPFFMFAAQTGTSALFSFLLQPYWIILLCLLYFDCRVRRDGLDVSRLADDAGLPHPSGPLPGSPTLAVPLTIYRVSDSGANPVLPQMPYQPPQANLPYYPPGQPPPYAPPPHTPPGGARQ